MAPRYKIPSFILLTVLLVVVIKVFLPAPKLNTELRDQFWLRKTHTTEKFNVVVGGDSRIYRGFSVASLTKAAGGNLDAINMGYSSAGFSSEYLNLLVDKLETAGNRYLVLGMSPHSFTLDGAKNELYHQYKETNNFEVFKGKYLFQYLKHFVPYSASELKDRLIEEPNEDGYHEDFKPDGWVKSYKIPEDSLIAIDIYRKTFTDYQVSDSLISTFFLDIDHFKKAGIKIIAFRPPTFDMMSELEDSISGYSEVYMRAEMELRGCEWIDLENSDFHTYDGSHLHFKSAEKLGGIVGERIMKIQ